MKRSSGSKEAFDINSNDDSINDQPTVKSVKMEAESVSSEEIVELREKVAKLEKDFQGACNSARQFELLLVESKKRVEFLENLLDKNSVVAVDVTAKKNVDELQKKLDKAESQLKEARFSMTTLTEKANKEIAKVREILAERSAQISILEEQLETERREDSEYQKEVQEKWDEAAAQMRAAADQIEIERSKVIADQTRDREKIDELMLKLAEYEGGAFDSRENIALKLEIVELTRSGEKQLEEMRREHVISMNNLVQKYEAKSEEAATHSSTVQLQLEVERWRANEVPTRDRARIDELSRKLAEYEALSFKIQQKANEDRMKDNAKIDDAENRLIEARKKFAIALSSLTTRMETERCKAKDEIAKVKEMLRVKSMRVPSLTQQLETDNPVVKKVKFDDLSTKLALYEDMSVSELLPLPPPPQPPEIDMGLEGEKKRVYELEKTPPPEIPLCQSSNDPSNMLRASTDSETIPYQLAVQKLSSKCHKDDPQWMKRFQAATKDDKFYCEMCRKRSTSYGILKHFFSSGHSKKIRAENDDAISSAAVSYWMQKLESCDFIQID